MTTALLCFVGGVVLGAIVGGASGAIFTVNVFRVMHNNSLPPKDRP